MKTETTITLNRSEAIEMLLKHNPHVNKFVIEDDPAILPEHKFIHIRGGFLNGNISYVAFDTVGNVWTIFKDGTRDKVNGGYTLQRALQFVKDGFWKEI